jgi:hypothetical protein
LLARAPKASPAASNSRTTLSLNASLYRIASRFARWLVVISDNRIGSISTFMRPQRNPGGCWLLIIIYYHLLLIASKILQMIVNELK